VELVVVAGNFPVRCHGLDVAQLLEPWLLAGGLYHSILGLRTDPESTKSGTIDVEGADLHCVIVSTVSFGLSYRYYKDIHFRIGLPVLGS